MNNVISEDTYYGRHFRLPGFTRDVQARLTASRVLVVGVGGLGCPAAMYLAGAGVGHITLCDADVVSLTNLHRQVLFHAESVGQKKVEVAARRLRASNPLINIETLDQFADASMLERIVADFDLVLDGTDNFSAKFAINDACEAAGVPLVYGSIFQFEGQVSVFHLRGRDGSTGYSYRDLYPYAPPPNLTQNCGEAGVVGVLPGVIGTLQATEAIKVLAGIGHALSGTLLTYDALGSSFNRLSLTRRAEAPTSRLEAVDEVGYEQVQQMLSDGAPVVLVDVREPHERQAANVGGVHIPLADLHNRLAEVPEGRDIVVYCKSGMRASRAALYLRSVRPGVRVLNMRGGIDAVIGPGLVCAG